MFENYLFFYIRSIFDVIYVKKIKSRNLFIKFYADMCLVVWTG
jgi:hypothetical protein